MKKGIVLAAVFLAIPLAAGFARSARAEGACTVTQADLDAIGASPTFAQELALRKALLAKTLACAKTDAESLQVHLNAARVGVGAEDLRSHFSDKLNDAVTYYDIELAKIGSLGISGTQAVARESLAWRAANYVPLAGQIANFIFWSENQNLFAAAKARLDQTTRIVVFFENAAQNADLENALGAAVGAYNAAAAANADAKSALAQFLPPDQSLDLVKHSLDLLSLTYQKFLNLSTIIQSLLSPINK